MTESLPRLTPQPPDTPAEFPNGNASDDKVYQMANPANPLQQLAIMSMEGYVKMGTILQSLRAVAREQDKKIKELIAENKVLVELEAKTRSRLENLRAVRKAEKRPEIEQLIEMPAGYASPPTT